MKAWLAFLCSLGAWNCMHRNCRHPNRIGIAGTRSAGAIWVPALQTLELQVPSAGFQAKFGTHCPLGLWSAASSPQSQATGMTPCDAIQCCCQSAPALLKPCNGFRPWLGKVSHCLRLTSTQHACTYPHHVYLIIVRLGLLTVCRVLKTLAGRKLWKQTESVSLFLFVLLLISSRTQKQ